MRSSINLASLWFVDGLTCQVLGMEDINLASLWFVDGLTCQVLGMEEYKLGKS